MSIQKFKNLAIRVKKPSKGILHRNQNEWSYSCLLPENPSEP